MELQSEEFKLPIEVYFTYGIPQSITLWVEIEEIISILFQIACKKKEGATYSKTNHSNLLKCK
jgi:hypothetical protein